MLDDPIVDVLDAVVDVLAGAGVAYAITGSVASSIHGEPITSQDIDLVVRMSVGQARRLAAQFPKRFYRSEESLVEAAERHSIANLLDAETGLKVDLSVLPPGDYFDCVFERCCPTPFGPDGPDYQVVTAEDIILMKLEWRKDTRSEKQWENALSVARVKGARMDWKYLLEQADSLRIKDDLVKLRNEAGI